MRYNVGQKYIFINIQFTAPAMCFGSTYLPWMDKLDGIELIELTCAEHRQVPGEWDDEIKYDGFRFRDTENRLWNNQWPRASYGQLDDSADRRAKPDFDTWKENRTEDELRGIYRKYMSTTDVCTYLQNVERGIAKLAMDSAATVEHAALKAHFDEVIDLLAKQGVTATIVPKVWKSVDGTEKAYPDIKVVSLTFAE